MYLGLALNDDIKWLCFHGTYDFAYFLKMLIGCDLPANEKGFYNHLKYYFPEFVDIKFLVKDIETLKFGGLSRLADVLNVIRKINLRYI